MKVVFVTVGTQLPFDRLITTMDEWAINNPKTKVIGQIGNSSFIPNKMEVYSCLTPTEYRKIVQNADIIVGHLGTGTIASAYENSKPAILMPRMKKLIEHRNEHQLNMASNFIDREGIYIANDKNELFALLEKFEDLKHARDSSSKGREQLIDFLTNKINE